MITSAPSPLQDSMTASAAVPSPAQVRDEMLRCLQEASTDVDSRAQGYLESVFQRVGAAFDRPDAAGLERELSVLRADAFRLGRSVEVIQSNVARLYRMVEQTARRTAL